MIWLWQFLTLVSCVGPGYTIPQSTATPRVVVNGVLGESVILPLKLSAGQEDLSIVWLHGMKAVIFIEPKEAQIKVIDPKWKDRLIVNQSYLQINNLTMADSGHYNAQISTSNSVKFSHYSLKIFGRLRNLQVTNHTQVFENGTCEIHLTCSVENQNDHVSFRWQVTGNTSLEETNLTISWNPRTSSEQTFTCMAMNPVSHISFSFSSQSLCKGSLNKDNPYLNIIWILIVASLICITVLLFVQRKKAGSLWFRTHQTQSPEEVLRNSEYNSGNTVYAQVIYPKTKTEHVIPTKNNDSSTIYSTVSQSKQENGP